MQAVDQAKGLYKATVQATDKAGTGKVEIKLADNTIALSLNLTVDADTTVATRKLELVDTTADQTVDLNPLEEDRVVQFVFNQYNAAGIFIGEEQERWYGFRNL